MKFILSVTLSLTLSGTALGQHHWMKVASGMEASFRGVSVVDDRVAWVSGSGGWVGNTLNAGLDWSFNQVKGFEKSEFRSLFAWNAKRAVIANAGSPACILLTEDGGKNWKKVYYNEEKEAFFDGMDFWNDKEGMAYGDPIKGKMLLVKTEDGGQTWKELPDASRPSLGQGEASFAASGTGIRWISKNNLLIATGGKISRLFSSADKGVSWSIITPPIVQGKSSTGIFSIAALNEKYWVIVGGDFENDTLKSNHVFYSQDGGKKWVKPEQPTRGYRECVEFIDTNTIIATGPAGTDFSDDGGKTWMPLREAEALHVVRKARKGKLMVMAGGKGTILVGQ